MSELDVYELVSVLLQVNAARDAEAAMTMPAELAVNLLFARARFMQRANPGRSGGGGGGGDGGWVEHGDGRRTLRIKSIDQLRRALPRKK